MFSVDYRHGLVHIVKEASALAFAYIVLSNSQGVQFVFLAVSKCHDTLVTPLLVSKSARKSVVESP